MTELKTLKDIKANPYDSYWKESVKAEAIKDYKYYVKVCPDDNVADYIKWKNNLTEEDLEDEEK